MSHVFDWEYAPARGKFTVKVMSNILTEHLHLSSWPTLEDATRTFARFALPVRFQVGSCICDEDGVYVLRYMCFDDPMEAGWWGCEAAFRALDDLGVGTSVDRAIWEQRAKYTMGVPT